MLRSRQADLAHSAAANPTARSQAVAGQAAHIAAAQAIAAEIADAQAAQAQLLKLRLLRQQLPKPGHSLLGATGCRCTTLVNSSWVSMQRICSHMLACRRIHRQSA